VQKLLTGGRFHHFISFWRLSTLSDEFLGKTKESLLADSIVKNRQNKFFSARKVLDAKIEYSATA